MNKMCANAAAPDLHRKAESVTSFSFNQSVKKGEEYDNKLKEGKTLRMFEHKMVIIVYR